jgi:hypothetical protein
LIESLTWLYVKGIMYITALAPNLWKDLFSMHELTEIMRQKDDLDFAQLFNRLRENRLTEIHYKILEKRKITRDDPEKRSFHKFGADAVMPLSRSLNIQSSNTGFSCNKSPTASILTPPKDWLFPADSFNLQCIAVKHTQS